MTAVSTPIEPGYPRHPMCEWFGEVRPDPDDPWTDTIRCQERDDLVWDEAAFRWVCVVHLTKKGRRK